MLASRILLSAAVRRAASTMASTVSTSTAVASDFINYVNASPSPYHATAETESRLKAAGFTRLFEREEWSVSPGGKYYVVRNQSAIIAFAVGGKYAPGVGGFTVAAGHTDSPCLKVKAASALVKSGFLSVGVETYGGGIWATWLDRDLSVAGRAIVSKSTGGFESRLVRIAKPILRVPTLAIHLNREVNEAGLKLNNETQLVPMLATVAKALEGKKKADEAAAAAATAGTAAATAGAASAAAATAAAAVPSTAGATTRHHSALVSALAKEMGTGSEDIKDFDLCLYDTQPAALGGLEDEFIFAPRLDNLLMSYACFSGLIASAAATEPIVGAATATTVAAASSGAGTADAAGAAAASTTAPVVSVPLAEDVNVRIAAAFDHEECGSDSVPGAGGTFLEDVLTRLCPDPTARAIALRKSLLVSADMAHAAHPNYPEKHAENLRPEIHKGIVIKANANQRYATTSVTSFICRQIAAEAGVPVQTFTNRQDMGCGSTIGPITATRLGLRTVDIGVPQLSMHSAREVCGTDDTAHALNFLTYFYGRFAALDASMEHAD